MWPIDKLTLVQDALGLTGNNVVNVLDDGSPEGSVASLAYEAALPYAIEGHDWKYATTVAVLTPTGTAPTDPLFDTAYAKPQGLLHLIWVRFNDMPVDYQILDNQIVLKTGGAAGVATAKFVRAPSMDQVTPTFAMGLRALVMSGIYRGLNKDADQANIMWKAGENFLAQARTRSDQETPKRALFVSQVTAARRNRLPAVSSPLGWPSNGS